MFYSKSSKAWKCTNTTLTLASVSLFIQSLYSKSLRATLLTYVDIKEIRDANLVIEKPINLEEGPRLAEKEVNDQAQHDNQKDDPMDIDFMQPKRSTEARKKCFQASPRTRKTKSKLVNRPNSMTSSVIQSVDIVKAIFAIMSASRPLMANTTSIK
jgi:hypothetical protein